MSCLKKRDKECLQGVQHSSRVGYSGPGRGLRPADQRVPALPESSDKAVSVSV